jgi:hypothetical protein
VGIGSIPTVQWDKMMAEFHRVWWSEFPSIRTKLWERLTPYVEADHQDLGRADLVDKIRCEAERLKKESFGIEVCCSGFSQLVVES